jgi:hypothetical protein
MDHIGLPGTEQGALVSATAMKDESPSFPLLRPVDDVEERPRHVAPPSAALRYSLMGCVMACDERIVG